MLDEIGRGIGQGIAHAGPEIIFALGTVLIFAWLASQGMPFFAKYKMALLDIEKRREDRKAEESKLREDHDRESERMQGQWLEQQARSNLAMERSNEITDGLRVQLERLADSVEDSKSHSRDMAHQVEEIHRTVCRKGNA